MKEMKCFFLEKYDTAQKLRKAEDTEHLETSTDQEKGRGKRRRFLLLSSSSDDDETGAQCFNLPEPPFRRQRLMVILFYCNNGTYYGNFSRSPQTEESDSMVGTRTILKEMAFLKAQNEVIISLFGQGEVDVEEPAQYSYPLMTINDVEEVEKSLKNSEAARKQLRKVLSRIGGTTVRNTTANMLKHFLHDSVGVNYSLYGQKGKKALVSMELFKLIVVALGLGEEAHRVALGLGEEAHRVALGLGEEAHPVALGDGEEEIPVALGRGEEAHRVALGHGEEAHRAALGLGEEARRVALGLGEEAHPVPPGLGEDTHRLVLGIGEEAHPVALGLGEEVHPVALGLREEAH
ncbi:hypothetical protein V5799_024522 [Amblyomma americanum]|uniref:DUF4806 domain-containing protein n=1 Tax=Amblyomma americanum TaxID=6943 RepID=A0AAQ4EC30_AMBAM